MALVEKNSFDELVNNLSQVHCVLQNNAAKAVDQFLSLRNRTFGYYIVEYEQNGEDRAKYGERILKCHVLIDLKVDEFDYADAGQMNAYLNYYKENEMMEDDNLPIGIIIS